MDQWLNNAILTLSFCAASFALGFKFGMEYLQSQLNKHLQIIDDLYNKKDE